MQNSDCIKLYETWEKNGFFTATPQNKKLPFTIMIPPPNVTGNLHLGHAFTMTMQDITIRYKRMLGFDTLLLPGTDHAGIATQMLVEKKLTAEGIDRKQIGRTAFIKKVWEWKNNYAGNIQNQLRTIGYSADWTRERFTMDDTLATSVKEAFIRLYDKGLIYKDSRLVNWDPSLLTTVSDLEVEQTETEGNMYHLTYPIDGSNEKITVATTRPETMLGDTGIAVHPNDERYKHLIGKYAILPLIGRKIPIVGDDYADMEKGTGAVKITPAHDFNDFEVGKRHDFEIINILDKSAHIDISQIENPSDFINSLNNKDRFEARNIIIAELKSTGILTDIKKYIQTIPHSQRGGAIIEPRLTTQWYVNVKEMAKKSIDLVTTGKLEFIPKMWENTFFSWLENIQPWCISRQLWWGHQIPAYYTENGDIIVAKSLTDAQAQAKEKFGTTTLTQDEDVLDTWFSSGLWPFSTLGWPDTSSPDFKKYFPTSTLITGFDIIFFWVARMVMLSVELTGQSPFKTVVIHGLLRDENGEKMSKTKGNVINPLDLIDEFGIDAVRWTIATLSGQGRDINFGKTHVENGRKFITKLTNALTFWEQKGVKEYKYSTNFLNTFPLPNWIIDRMNTTIINATTAIENYRFDEYARILYHFVWDDFCDNFIEMAKGQINEITLGTANIVIKNILKLLQPIIPYTTAEHWEILGFGKQPDLITQPYPIPLDLQKINENQSLIKITNVSMDIIGELRNLRLINNISFKESFKINTEIDAFLMEIITSKTNTEIDNTLTDKTPNIIIKVVGDDKKLLILLPQIDKNEEIEKAKIELSETKKFITSLTTQLSNKTFTDKAPANIIADRKESLDKLKKKQETLEKIIG